MLLLIVSMMLLAFIAGWLSASKKVYVYANPFVGAPASGCAYAFQLGKAGGPITRTPCY
jgi:hypothetical protein